MKVSEVIFCRTTRPKQRAAFGAYINIVILHVFFYRATLCVSAVFAVVLSVSRVGVLYSHG